MTILWSNNASTTLSGSITSVATSVSLSAGTGSLFPSPTGGNYYVATFYDQATKTVNEIVHVTAMSGDVATIVRAQEGTTAKAWNAGDIFANLVTAGTLNAFVQAGTGPANTSIVYVGTDTSATPGLIVATTNPVPASLAVGMLFNIKVANTTPGTTMMQLNGGTSIETVRTDGSHMVGGNVVAGQEFMFVYNGSTFTSTIPPIPAQPPQNVFYVNPSGNDNNSGFANTSGAAFATIHGAVSAISTRYISQNGVTIRVADGTYTGGFAVSSQYIASWNIIGDVANPAACVIDATSTSPPAGASPGGNQVSGATVTLSGFTFKSYYANIACNGGGSLTAHDCYYTGPVSGQPPIYAEMPSEIFVYGQNQFNAAGVVVTAIWAAVGGQLIMGYHDIYSSYSDGWTLTGAITVAVGSAVASQNGVVTFDPYMTGFAGTVPTGPRYSAQAGGGIAASGQANLFPGTSPGTIVSPGWVI